MQQPQHIRSLDGLRGLASFAVVLSHIILLFPRETWAGALVFGNEAVALFFCLSGFLMAYLYGGKSFTRRSATDYLVHRFARIYPVYFVAVISVALLSVVPWLEYPQPLAGSVEIIRHITLLGSTGVFWSIPPEIQFYVFFLMLWFWFEKPKDRLPLGIAIAIGFVMLAYLGFPGPGILLPSKISYFLFGALAGRLFALTGRLDGGHAAGFLTLAALAFFLASRAIFHTEESFWGVTSALAATVIVFLTATESGLLAPLLGSAPLRHIGKISFSLYLFHMPVMFLTSKALPESLPVGLTIALCIVAAMIFADISYRIVEAPSRTVLMGAWKRRTLSTPLPA